MTVEPGSNEQACLTCPDNHHPHMIDLGLPSGTLWACCNVCAGKPEGSGGYWSSSLLAVDMDNANFMPFMKSNVWVIE